MPTVYNKKRFPEPPANLPREVAQYLREVQRIFNDGEAELERAFGKPEEVTNIAPDRTYAGQTINAGATLGATGDFGSGEGLYRRNEANSAWVFIG